MARVIRKKPFVRRRPCQFCLKRQAVTYIDYKNEAELVRLVNMQGKILSSRITGTCARHQRAVALAIKRARYMAILPYIGLIKKDRDEIAQDQQKVEVKKMEESVKSAEPKATAEATEESKPKRTRKAKTE
ncbi:ribosomal protein S18 [Metamycoplasma arthritidis]|uniref:Small ribosomal subunit protein bS18 n=1 Tax=Metamycoplasma arthritidis (strain 158L3-1) TaxID=243272 RepID=RS18_META1|nr:RecName: Full=Small ribosomal subunit protein bS18; AltName: Full=30S ribosomal protein S18 [Metamycoplasma arthritidis 158L3-1]ACF07460.1 ribosomal protein S18 [Metamycoplasma arthritidis 158L3-1]VEU78981.1 ribosomal protein S18 [Metamycoplasma arthritidis]